MKYDRLILGGIIAGIFLYTNAEAYTYYSPFWKYDNIRVTGIKWADEDGTELVPADEAYIIINERFKVQKVVITGSACTPPGHIRVNNKFIGNLPYAHDVGEPYGAYPFKENVTTFILNKPTHLLKITGGSRGCNNHYAFRIIETYPEKAVNPIPEPTTLILLGSGIITTIGAYARKRNIQK
jgi:hypothetical protein